MGWRKADVAVVTWVSMMLGGDGNAASATAALANVADIEPEDVDRRDDDKAG